MIDEISYRPSDRVALEDPYLREYAALGVGLTGGQWGSDLSTFWLLHNEGPWCPLSNSEHTLDLIACGGFHVGTTWLKDDQVQIVVHVPGHHVAAVILTGRYPKQTLRAAVTLAAAQLYLRKKTLEESA